MLKQLASVLPIEGRGRIFCALLATVLLLSPVTPSFASYIYAEWLSLPLSVYSTAWDRDVFSWIQDIAFCVLLILLCSRWAYPTNSSMSPKPAREVVIGDMTFSESALFTNIMITGAIGSGKTSSAIYPILDQICQIYNVWDEKTAPDNPYKKWGGLVMDVKGDFYEALICLLHWSGRNVLEDLVVITPWANYAYAEMQDPDTGFYWYVALRGGPSPESIEFNDLLSEHTMPDSNRKIPIDYFTLTERIDDLMPGTTQSRLQFFQTLEFHPKPETNFIGWRNTKNGKLVRILKTDHELHEVLYTDKEHKEEIVCERPKKLKYVRTRFVNNGLTFNIAPPSLTHIELANRLVAMSKNSSGKGGGGGDNSFWDDATKKHIQWVIYLLRTINPGVEVTALDINAHTVSDSVIQRSVRKLCDKIQDLESKSNDTKVPPEERADCKAQVTILNDVREYFEQEWKTLDQRTKSNLVSTITNVFTQFLSDPRLRTVFCSSTAVTIDEIMQSGKIYTLVAPEYESAARVFGTSLKMEFQAIMKRRTASAEYDKTRFVAFICDEVQNFVTTGGNDPTSGDESFMALSRQSKVCNVVATQTDASIINVVGDKPAEVYYAQFGSRLWYQNTDQKTNERAAKILGKEKREKMSTSGQDVSIGGLFSKDSSGKGYSENISYESKEKYPVEAFSNLNVHQCIIYNKSKKGKRAKSCKCQLKPHYIGAPNMVKEKAHVLRWYFRAYMENRLAELGDQALLNHIKGSLNSKEDLRKDIAPKDVAVADEKTAMAGIDSENIDDFRIAGMESEEDPEVKNPTADPQGTSMGTSEAVSRLIEGRVLPSAVEEDDNDEPPVYGYTYAESFQRIYEGSGLIPVVKERTKEGVAVLSNPEVADAPSPAAEQHAREIITELDSRMSRGITPAENVTNMVIKEPAPISKASDLIDGSDTVMTNMRSAEVPVIKSAISILDGDQLTKVYNPDHPDIPSNVELMHKHISVNWAKMRYAVQIPILGELGKEDEEPPKEEPKEIENPENYEVPKEELDKMKETNELPVPSDEALASKPNEEESDSSSNITSHVGGSLSYARRFSKYQRHPTPTEKNVKLETDLSSE